MVSEVDKAMPEFDLVIIGAGFAGMYMLHRAREMGLSARVFEAGDDVGGTWYWNRYPGARCDVESLQYSYSWDEKLQQEWDWSERYATQPEILSYARHVADRHDLRRDIQFGARVARARYDDDAHIWVVGQEGGQETTCRFLILATGCLSAARIPDFPGRDDFQGETYHSGDWPHDGASFDGKRVAVIGTGSSGIQMIPLIAEQAAHLTVFQRTPNFSVPARNQPLSPDLVRGWKVAYPELRRVAREEADNGILYDPPSASALSVSEQEREDTYRWRWEKGGANFSRSFDDLVLDRAANDTAADFVRDRIRQTVKDPTVAEMLCPYDYPIFTKRICVDSQYYETFNRENVSLVSLRETPLERIEPNGVRTSDQLHEVDAIVYATGFDAMTGAITAIDIVGSSGKTISKQWEEGPKAYLGLCVHNFPNLFTITGPGSPSVLSNVIVSIEQHVDLIAGTIAHMRSQGLTRIEASERAQARWMEHVAEVASLTLMPETASWYMGANIPGKPRVFMPYIGVAKYRMKCDEVVADDYRGFEFATLGRSGWS